MNKSKKIIYKKYNEERRVIERRIVFKREIAEQINKLIAIFKDNAYGLKMNNSILINIAMEHYLSYINSLDEEEAIDLLKNKVLAIENH